MVIKWLNSWRYSQNVQYTHSMYTIPNFDAIKTRVWVCVIIIIFKWYFSITTKGINDDDIILSYNQCYGKHCFTKKMSHHIWWSTFGSSLSRVSYHNKNARKHINDTPAIICEFLYKDQKCCIQIKAHMNLQNNLVAWWRHMATKISVNIGSGNVLLPDDTRPLPEQIRSSDIHLTTILQKIFQPPIIKIRLKIT